MSLAVLPCLCGRLSAILAHAGSVGTGPTGIPLADEGWLKACLGFCHWPHWLAYPPGTSEGSCGLWQALCRAPDKTRAGRDFWQQRPAQTSSRLSRPALAMWFCSFNPLPSQLQTSTPSFPSLCHLLPLTDFLSSCLTAEEIAASIREGSTHDAQSKIPVLWEFLRLV